jgi:hypothetical protein
MTQSYETSTMKSTRQSFGSKEEVAQKAWAYRIRLNPEDLEALRDSIAALVREGADPLSIIEVVWKIGFYDALVAFEHGAVGFSKIGDN